MNDDRGRSGGRKNLVSVGGGGDPLYGPVVFGLHVGQLHIGVLLPTANGKMLMIGVWWG